MGEQTEGDSGSDSCPSDDNLEEEEKRREMAECMRPKGKAPRSEMPQSICQPADSKPKKWVQSLRSVIPTRRRSVGTVTKRVAEESRSSMVRSSMVKPVHPELGRDVCRLSL